MYATFTHFSTLESWTNLTVYRTTPVNYTGLTNMDSGNSAGDAVFGLSQLLLPVMCPSVPDFQWCENRAYLSDGTAHMVYTEFIVAVRESTYGEYAACNPNKTTGVFQCRHYGSSQRPAQCTAGSFALNDFDCFNGTKFRTVEVEEADGVGACCAACSAASDLDANRCVAWNMPTTTTCELLTDPLVMAPALLGVKGGCVAAGMVDTDPEDQPRCWYDDPDYNTSSVIQRECDKAHCGCALISDLAVGRESGAMCHHHSSNMSTAMGAHVSGAWPPRRSLPGSFATAASAAPSAPTPDAALLYWRCGEALFDSCSATIGDAPRCAACASSAAGVQLLECSAEDVVALCSPMQAMCNATVVETCPAPSNPSPTDDVLAGCRTCALSDSKVKSMRAAHCNASLVNAACIASSPGGGGDMFDNEWIQQIMGFGCHMNGTWFSSTATAEGTNRTKVSIIFILHLVTEYSNNLSLF